MSLFETKTWWSTRVAVDDEFDAAHQNVSNIDNDASKSDKIVVGSFGGLLKIYQPQFGEYKASQLLYENQFNEPILQISTGRYSSMNDQIVLCILHFRTVAFYQFKKTKNEVSSKMIAKCDLERNAYNFIPGKFGDSEREMICIQSEDGILQFCDLNKIFCSIKQNNFIIPGPIEYIPKVDCICIQNSCYELEAYKYESIFSKHASPSNEKALNPFWKTLIGETAQSFSKYETSQGYVLVSACEHHIFILTGNGGLLRSIKKLNCVPSYFVVNEYGPSPHLNFVLGSFSHHLLFYKDFDLVWAAKTNHIPHGIKIATFAGQKGLMVLLNDEGWLEVSYLGTELPKTTIPNLETRDQSYQELNDRLNEMNSKLDSMNDSSTGGGFKDTNEALTIKSKILPLVNQPDHVEESEKYFKDESDNFIGVNLRVSLGFNGREATKICVNINAPAGFHAQQSQITLDKLQGKGTPYNFETIILVKKNTLITSNIIDFCASYEIVVENSNQTLVAYSSTRVPTWGFTKLFSPTKDAAFKVLVEVSEKCPESTELYSDYIDIQNPDQQYTSNPNVLCFMLNSGQDCTLLFSKASNKVRIQSNYFEGKLFLY